MDHPPCIVCGLESLPGCLTCYWHEPMNAVAWELYNETGEYPNGVQIIARLLQDNAMWQAQVDSLLTVVEQLSSPKPKQE